jgi:hypothetical protein
MNLSIRKHLSYANVVATMALVFAMSGSALAAKHYLITSTGQISPKVLEKLTGKAGNTGALGAQGPTGAAGKEGTPGAAGKEGTPGKEGAPGGDGAQGATGATGSAGAQGSAGTSGKEGVAGHEGKAGLSLLSESEQQKLKSILPYIKYVASGVDGKPTIQFSGVNVQLASGVGKEAAINGEGNLIIGYDESPGSQIGSDNLVLGDKQTYLSYGAVLGGEGNTASGEDTDVFGKGNGASGEWASVGGGSGNIASGGYASVSGGEKNTASGVDSSISGGHKNSAESYASSISGGDTNFTEGYEFFSTLGKYAWVGGGYGNVSEGEWTSIFGGKEEGAIGSYSAIP